MIFIIFVLVLGVLVFIHEFGHFAAAKLLGVRVEQFSLGLPPKMVRIFKKGDTEYILSWIPFGGYVKLTGENPDDDKLTGADYELTSKPPWVRFIIFFAGVFMNFVLGVVIFTMVMWLHGTAIFPITPIDKIEPNSIAEKFGLQVGDKIVEVNHQKTKDWEEIINTLYTSVGQNLELGVERNNQLVTLSYTITEEDSIGQKGSGFIVFVDTKVGGVQKDSPADKIGLQRDDMIISIDGEPVTRWQQMTEIIYNKPNETLWLTWKRDGNIMSAEITPQEKLAPDEEQFGKTKKVGMIGVRSYQVTQREPFGRALKAGFLKSIFFIKFIFLFLGMLVGGKVPADSIGGPITVYQAVGESFQWGWAELLNFTAVFSVNLAVLNILPIPALDGGHILLLIVEAIKRGPLKLKTKIIWQQVGMAFVFLLIIFATFNDIIRTFFR